MRLEWCPTFVSLVQAHIPRFCRELEKRVSALFWQVPKEVPKTDPKHSFILQEFGKDIEMENFEAKLSSLPRDLRVSYNQATKTLSFDYDEFTIRALSNKYRAIGMVIGYDYHTCFDGYVNRYGWQHTGKFQIETKALIKKSQDYFKDKSFEQNSLTLDRSLGLQEQLRKLLSHADGIIFGENHNETAPKAFLCHEMKAFVEQGVDTLYIEHLCHEGLQVDLDDYFAGSEISTALHCALKRLNAGYFLQGTNYLDLIEKAKGAGIRRIVALDSAASYCAGSDQRDGVTDAVDRHTAFIYQAKTIMDRHKPPGKYIALIGARHLTKQDKVPGLGELYKVPELYILGSKDEYITLRQNCEVSCSGTNSVFPFVAEIPEKLPCSHKWQDG